MSSETLNLIFVIAAMAVGCFSVLLEVLYLFEAGRGVNELSFKEYKRYINVTFLVSNLILAFLWLTTHQMDGLVPILFVVQMGLWFVTGVAGAIAATVCREPDMFRAVPTCVLKVLLLLILMWLVF
jgi:hypothetical protein